MKEKEMKQMMSKAVNTGSDDCNHNACLESKSTKNSEKLGNDPKSK